MSKKQTFRTIAFFIILIGLIAGLSIFLRYTALHDDSAVHPKLKHLVDIQKEPVDTLDVIILGNSLSYTSVIPMQLWNNAGMTAYCAGQSGQSMQEAYETMKVIYKTQSPKVVLLETGLFFWGAQGTSAWVDQLNTWLDYHVPLYQLHDMWKSTLTGKTYTEENLKGYAFRKNVAPYTGPEYLIQTEETEEFPPLIEMNMKRLMKLCREHNTELILFSSISPVNYTTERLNKIKAFSDKNALTYFDFNHMTDVIGFDWKKDCLDGGDHINHYGAKKTTVFLTDYLTSAFYFEDHRMHPAFDHWHKTSEIYQQKDR